MPCKSAKLRKNSCSSLSSNARAKTAIKRDAAESARHKSLIAACRDMGNKCVKRGQHEDIDFQQTLRVVGTSTACNETMPKRKYRIYPTVMPQKEINRIQARAKTKTLEEKMEDLQRIKEEHDKIAHESEMRKNALKELDDARMKAKLDREKEKEKENAANDSDDDSNVKVLERAFLAKQEQEEEVKRANRIILEAKCCLIRDAQIAEKQELAREIHLVDKKLDQLMLDERDRHHKQDDEKLQREEEQKAQYAKDIKAQLIQRECLKQMEADRIQEEARMNILVREALDRDEQTKQRVEHDKKMNVRADLKRVAEINKLFRKLEFQQQRAAEMQIQAYIKQREEREKQLALERKLAKEAAERNQQKLFSMQERLITSKGEQDDFNLRREQERREREFRRQEKEKAMKKRNIEQEILQSRNCQLEEAKRRQAMQIARDEADFNSVICKLREEEEKERQKEQTRLKNREKYREEIIRQMNQKEMDRREMQRKARNEFIAWQEREQTREKNIRAVIQSKLNQMKEANMPEKYIKDVEKQLKLSVK